MDSFVSPALLALVSVLLTLNLYILRGLREDFKEESKKLWEKIDLVIEKHDKTAEKLAKTEADVENCVREWNRKHGEIK